MAKRESRHDRWWKVESKWPSPSTPEQHYLDDAIRCGDLDGARSFVENLTPEIRQKITEDSNLMVTALRKNKPEFIRFLVEECNAELLKSEMKNVRKSLSSDSSITPLRFAARFKKTEAAVALMRLGANVNAVSPNSRLTALHEACKNGTLVIVRHLIQHGADLSISDIHGKTALMYGVDHVAVCRELIDNGVDVNVTNNAGDTALHSAAHNSTEAAKLLIDNGADPLKKNNKGEDALCIACMHEQIDTVKAMRNKLANDEVGHKALIRSHQLLGACRIMYHNPTHSSSLVAEALVEWEAAVRLREERRYVITGEDAIVSTPNSAYDNAVEVDSMPKFDEMRQDANKIYMQGLLLKEKILGPAHRGTIRSIIRLAEFYIRSEDYGRGLRLLRYGFKLLRDPRMDAFVSSLFMIVLGHVAVWQLDTLNKHAVNNTVDFEGVCEFLEAVTIEAKLSGQPTTEGSCEVNENFMRITFFLIKLFLLLEMNAVQNSQFRRLLSDFVRLNLRSFEGRTILLNAICFHKLGWYSPEVDVAKLLLDCGSDTWETDNRGNSVLHLLTTSEQWILEANKEESGRKLAEMLLEFGAHFDAINNDGFSAVDYLSSLGLEFSTHMTLQCLAAQAIRRHKIPYEGILPKSLVDFVQMH